MAGSLSHIVDSRTGKFNMDLIENLGDAHEALQECFELIRTMTGGSRREVNKYCVNLKFPSIDHDME
jgi:hypothetical protein